MNASTPRIHVRLALVALAALALNVGAPAAAEARRPTKTVPTEQVERAELRASLQEPLVEVDAPQVMRPRTFRWQQEELFYSVRVNDAEAMRAGLRTGELRRHQGRQYVPLSGTAQSRGFFHAVYPLHDRANTYLDPTTMRPLRTEKHFEERGQTRVYNVDYRHPGFEARVERLREDRSMRFRATIPDTTHDMLTWLYELRGQGELNVGDAFEFYIYDGWLLSRLDVDVVAREDILTPLGWFHTYRLDFARHIMDAEHGGVDDEAGEVAAPAVSLRESSRHTGSLWLSRDANFIPVRVTINTPLGAGEAVLIHYKPGTGA
ncbi:DUF3108 domain-containing protein [Lujinxingia sediminis]|uniref:DUF3108 domain-containing protein n=1 Tax=Lujinxingia sediminis TaxID=2480984 RepID=A0ABY0CT68_9DELT|nr:DUF3108 domain-containing protein [Lujinxingia sediminis]RVU44021.1 DUF3108 domain-containing protein [Lujinxingia sediminis]